jgi:hypothetical protein
MKFTIDRVRFAKMLRLAQRRMPGQKRAELNVVISACAGRVFLSANAPSSARKLSCCATANAP